ncbi:beta-galactosidase [Sinorhizobium americanum]|uniref:Beta-galactosidase n=1 Tax=Sinorhizobium americanum TaxID=194963 RepID=A0A1L3LZX8_9HYPH|nr:beta-galactosidase [Sinorhizobium americanum]APG95642.1 beta-galactosidase [Sinorhizobium americanum]OAP46115.1 beta-galactosidase [Sinorhizobium americanum]
MKRTAPAPLSVWRTLNLDDFLIGTPHYPEHVDESYWQRDAERMAAAGFNVVRLGEFAWHIMEPREGVFDFSFFDRAIEVLGSQGIKTIFCTPTATPPRWLTATYPEVLRVDENGRVATHGSRQHADTNSPVYRMHSRRITEALANHYRDNPHIIGWQTDNELNTTSSTSYSEATERAFRRYLTDRYEAIDALNFAWGGNFWATAYDNFDQVTVPRQHNPGFPSPGHVQDYHRFLAHATAAFQHDQVEILRRANPDWFIFHNLGRLEDIDFRGQFGQDLDFLGFDIYPMLYDEMRRTGGHAATQALHLDICRAYGGNFIVPEQASGFGAQPGFSTMTPEPGEMRRMALSSVARGADGLMFFRWRPAHYGAEIYWMGIIDHDDVPRRRYEEAAAFARDIARIKKDLLGTTVRMDVAIAGADFDNQEAYKTYPMGMPSPLENAVHLHRYCHSKGIACGFIHPEDDLSRIKLLYVPHWVMWKPEWNANIEAFVRNGGTLVIGAMTGTRDEHNHIPTVRAPGRGLSELCGVRVEEFGRVAEPGADGLFGLNGTEFGLHNPARRLAASSAARGYTFVLGNREHEAAHLYELLEVDADVEVLGRWSSRFASGRAAITSRRVGEGSAIYMGTYLTDALVESLAEQVFARAGIAPLVADLPANVEVTVREAADRKLLFVLNTDEGPVDLSSLPSGVDLLSGKELDGRLTLGHHGCAVIRFH